jgi:cytidylate kinase
MTAVPDAFIIDSSDKNAEEVFRVAMDFLEDKPQ